MNKSGIYIILNYNNNKIYVGSASDLKHRRSTHFSLLRRNKHYNKHLQFSYNKYTKENFQFVIIEYCDKDSLIQREQYYIDTLNPQYNIRHIADSNLGCKMPDSMRKAVSIRNKLLYQGEDNPFYGKKHTEETLEKFRTKYVASKLTKEDVLEIQNMIKNKIKQKVIMSKFNIARRTVSSISSGSYIRRDFNV